MSRLAPQKKYFSRTRKRNDRSRRRAFFLEKLEDRSLLAAVLTDKLDYAPAETAIISASGFQFGESVQFQVLHNDGTPNTGNGHLPWTVADGSAADLDGAVNGNIRTSWYVDPDDSAFSSFSLTADGLSSGLSASNTFTDAPAADLDHYGNVTGAWLDGNLGSNKASYLEGQSVPDRIIFTDLTPGVTYSITISYDTTKSGKHAFDYLTTYNRTISVDPLEGVSGVSATTSTFAIPIDTRVTNGQNGIDDGAPGPTGGDDITQIPGNFTYFGGTITAVSGYTLSGTYATDSTTSITVTFVPNSATSVLAWGAHIATRQDWGQNNSAVNISGSPYHVAIGGASANLGNVGAQDHQLDASAIIFPAQITVIKDVTGGQDPQDFNFAISASAGTQPSPASFILDDDSNSATPDTQVFSVTNFANYTVSETLLAGWTTSITVTDPNGVITPVNSNQNTFAVAEGQSWTLVFNNFKLTPALNITKDATVPGGTANVAGELISYTITVQNTGNMTLTGVVVTDPYANPGSIVRGADVSGDNDALLEVGETWSYTAAHTVTQAEIDSNGGGDGFLENIATADSNETGPDTDDANVPVARTPALNITKDATVPGGTANVAGENISYTITVQNTGNTTLSGVVVTDPYANSGSIVRGADAPGDGDALLEVGETWTYTAAHTVTQAEIDSNGGGDGLLENTATADSNETGADTDDANVPVARTPALNITKDATVPGGTANVAGELISYTITVQNTGNTTLTGVVVTDPYANPGSIVRGADAPGDGDALLEVGETWTYTAAHTVTQAEIDSNGGGDGLLENTATADSDETGADTDDANVPVARTPALNITKDASVPGGTADQAGDIISYTITVQNTGNTTLSGVVVTDPYADPGSIVRGADAPGDGDALLEVGETWTYTAAHTVTQAEIDSNGGGDGLLENTATADSNETGADTDDANVPVARTPALNITKSATVPGGTADVAGELISYTITVQNTGNTTLTGVVVTDPYANPGSIVRGADAPGDGDALLEVGETWTYTAAHTVTQAEIDSNGGGDGFLENIATADSNETGPDTDDANVPLLQGAALNITKDATVPGGTANVAGELISYTITVQNTGNTTLTGVVVTDPYANPGSIARGADAPGDGDALLEVGETWTYTAAHTVTQAEIDSNGGGDGFLENIATADSNQTDADTDDASVPVARTPALNITKSATVPGGTADVAGELISYTITVQNTGNTTLTGVVVTDPYANPGSIVQGADAPGDGDALLEVGETWTYTAAHTVTQAEIDSNGGGDGFLENIATADSTETDPDTDDANVPVARTPALNITKDASISGGTADVAGENIIYTITVQNTGNTTLSGVVVTDPYANPGSIVRGADAPGDGDALLEVGETWTYTATHTVTQAEIDSNGGGDGFLENTATADSNETGADTDDANVPVAVTPALNITKDASVPGGTADQAGDVISYTITVQNTGNTTLSGVVVTDSYADPGSIVRGADVSGDNDALLEVGETWSYTAAHTVTQAEIDSNGGGDGLLENTATADSTETGPDSDDANVPVAFTPALNITKDATVPGGTADLAGEVISYTITVQNTGNTTLSGVVVTDPYADPGSIVRGTDVSGDNDALLEVGETWSYTAAHTVTQAEIDSNGGGDGLLENTATADSTETGPDTDDANVPVNRNPAVNIIKDVSVADGSLDTAGELIIYTIFIQNIGNVTLDGSNVSDDHVAVLDRVADVIGDNDNLFEVGEVWEFHATIPVTQDQLDAGLIIHNVATVTTQQTAPDDDDADVPVVQIAGIHVIKEVNGNDANTAPGVPVQAGSTVTFTFEVSNTGNAALQNVVLVDNTVSTAPVLSGGFNVGDTDQDNQLDVTETWLYTASDIALAGQHTNTATATGSTSGGQPASDTDDGNYFGVAAAIDIEKFINGQDADVAPGPTLTVGSTATFSYIVVNSGNVPLTNVIVVDNNGTPGNLADDFNPTFTGGDVNFNGQLEVGETWTYVASRAVVAGQYTNIATVTAFHNSTETQVTDSDAANYLGQNKIIVITPDKTNGSLPFVHIVDLETGNLVRRFQAYELSYRGGVRVATGDLNGDGIDEIITAPGRGRPPLVKVFDQLGNLKYSFLAFASTFTGGVDLAVADVVGNPGPYLNRGDGKLDIIASMSYGGEQVRVFKNTSVGAIPYNPLAFTLFSSFDPFGAAFKGGATVDAIDMGNAITVGTTKTLSSTDFSFNRAEIVIGNGSGMRSTVKVYAFYSNSTVPTLVRTFLPLGSLYRGGISVETGRIDGDLVPDIIVSTGNGGGSQVQVLDGDSPGVVLKGFTAYSQASTPSFNAPVHTLALDSNGDGITDAILTAQGTDGTTRKVRQYTPLNSSLVDKFFENHSDFAGAYFLASLKVGSVLR